MKDEATDVIPFILLLGVVLSLCMNIILPMYKESKILKYDEIYDKTLTKVEGEQYEYNNSYFPGFSYSEIILVASSQTYFMPTPRVVRLGDSIFAIQAKVVQVNQPNAPTIPNSQNYIPDNLDTANIIKNAIYKWCLDYSTRYGSDGFKLRFQLRFTPAETESTDDDCYSLYVIGNTDANDLIYLRCLSDGEVEVKNGLNYSLLTK